MLRSGEYHIVVLNSFVPSSSPVLPSKSDCHVKLYSACSAYCVGTNIYTPANLLYYTSRPPQHSLSNDRCPYQASPSFSIRISNSNAPRQPHSTMTDTMPMPTSGSQLTRNDFSTEDLTKAFKASATKPRNNLSLRIVQKDETTVPPPSPLDSRPSSVYGRQESHRR